MFSNAKKFFKKNMLLIGIVLLLIIAVYFVYINSKEGFDQPVPEKVSLIPVSTIEKIYNNLTDPIYKDIGAPIVGLYKLFVANYNDAFDVSLQIVAANKEVDTAIASVPVPQPVNPDNVNSAAEDQANMSVFNKLKDEAKMGVLKKWAPTINPGIQRVLANAIRWLPTAKPFYDKLVLNNYYGLMDGTLNRNKPDMQITIVVLFMNTLYEEDQLSILFGPVFAKSNPNPPIKMPVNDKHLLQFVKRLTNPDTELPGVTQSQIYSSNYLRNLALPFEIIQSYVIINAQQEGINSIIPNTIIQLIEQLNNALANDATDQATIGQLTGNLNSALANDAADQATITNLQGQVYNLQSRQAIAPTPVSYPRPIQPKPIQPKAIQAIPIQARPIQAIPIQARPIQPMMYTR